MTSDLFSNEKTFCRSDISYTIPESLLDNIICDEINPLNRISELIEKDSKILDVGAGNGLLAQVFLRKNKRVYIDGIEPNAYAANIARPFYQKFFSGYAEDFITAIHWDQYDYVIMADVIEHLANPTFLLNIINKNIPDSTKVILSVPNISFGAVRISLMKGDFKYVDSGLIERTHIRFFTLATLKEIIFNTGMNLDKLIYLQKSIFSSEIPLNNNLRNILLMLFFMNDDTAFTYQYIVVLSKKSICCTTLRFGYKHRQLINTGIIQNKIKEILHY